LNIQNVGSINWESLILQCPKFWNIRGCP